MIIDNPRKPEKEISSEKHTLFIEDIPEQRILVDKKRKHFKIEPKFKVYRVYIESFLELKKGLHTVFNELRHAGKNDYLEFRINSSGGFVREGQQFYNLIQEKFENRTVAFLDNYGYSMGALLFCMAQRRVIYPYSDFMFHNYSAGAFGKGNEIESRVEHISKTSKKFFYDIIVKKGFLNKKEFEEMQMGKDFWMDSKELCQRKIATHVIIDGKLIKASKYLKMIKEK